MDDLGPRAPVEGEIEGLGRCSVFCGKVGGETPEVLQGRSPPLIQGLVGVAHHRKGKSVTEEQLEDHPLGSVGVLVFVGHHGPVAVPDPLGDLGLGVQDPVGKDDQVSVVHHPEPPFVVLVPVGRFHHSPPLGE